MEEYVPHMLSAIVLISVFRMGVAVDNETSHEFAWLFIITSIAVTAFWSLT